MPGDYWTSGQRALDHKAKVAPTLGGMHASKVGWLADKATEIILQDLCLASLAASATMVLLPALKPRSGPLQSTLVGAFLYFFGEMSR